MPRSPGHFELKTAFIWSNFHASIARPRGAASQLKQRQGVRSETVAFASFRCRAPIPHTARLAGDRGNARIDRATLAGGPNLPEEVALEYTHFNSCEHGTCLTPRRYRVRKLTC